LVLGGGIEAIQDYDLNRCNSRARPFVIYDRGSLRPLDTVMSKFHFVANTFECGPGRPDRILGLGSTLPPHPGALDQSVTDQFPSG
jgi:hypothetical protein